MPVRSGRPCSKVGCTNLSTERFCPEHSANQPKFYDRRRGSAASRGYDYLWTKVRKRALERDNYTCVACLAEDRVTEATDVDHIIAIAKGGDRLSLKNLQSLCASCHSKKTAREDGSFGRPRKLL